jgi:hypothetical protein
MRRKVFDFEIGMPSKYMLNFVKKSHENNHPINLGEK